MAGREGSSANAAAAADFVPVYEWHDGDGNYVLRLNLPGFKKEDFRVHVDTAGRLTVIGQRPADGGAGNVRLHKVFQLPPASNLDEITGRFDGSVLSLTVPKLPPPGAAELPAQGGKEEAVADKPPTDQKSKVGREAERLIEAAKARLAGRKKEEVKEQMEGNGKKPPAKKVGEAKPEPALPSQRAVPQRHDQEEKRKAAAEHKAKVERKAAAEHKAKVEREVAAEHKANVERKAAAEHKANVEREAAAEHKANVERKAAAEHKANVEREAAAEHKANVEREAERRIEAARTRLAMEKEAETEKKGSWKERAEEEGLKLAEAIGNHKEVIATAVAAFALGLFVSHKLFCRN